MKKLIILRGIPGAGKSTWARTYVEKHPDSSVILSMDSIRNMLGMYWIENREPLVWDLFKTCVTEIMSGPYKYDIVIDNTNLEIQNVKDLMDKAKVFGYHVREIIFDIPLNECQSRDMKRNRSVGANVIKTFYMKYCHENKGKIIQVTDNPKWIKI